MVASVTGDGGRAKLPAAQRWSKTFGGSAEDWAYSVQQTTDGGYVVAGFGRGFDPAEYSDCLLIKTDQNGTEVWSRVLGAPGGNDEGHCVQQTSDGGYILAGRTQSSGAGEYDVYLVKTRSNGTPVWSKTFGGSGRDLAYSVRRAFDGGYIVVGYTCSFGAAVSDVYIIKTDGDGKAPLPE